MTAMDPHKTCATCPAFLQPDEAKTKFKKAIGAPMCGRFGYVLGKPGMNNAQATKLQTLMANKCGAHGQPNPGFPVDWKMEVILPDPDSRIVTSTDKHEMCKSCAQCKNFVRDDVVADEFGWAAGLCAAKGKLIFPNRQVYEARECPYREFGKVRTSTAGLHLLPEYEDAFNLSVDPIKAYFNNKNKRVEPHEYPTDRPITDDDVKAGIRAWRRIDDPSGSGKFTHLPIYNPDFFGEAERAKIPRSGDDEHPELYIDHFGGVYNAAVAWTELDETPMVWGEAGVGKTELYRHLAWLMCLPFERFSITASTDIDDLFGKMQFSKEKGTYFQYGRLPLAWIKPCVICIDEPNVGPVDVWQAIRPLTDNSKQLVLDMNEHERLPRHQDCYMGMAANPSWDPRNIGAQPIADADARRLWHIYVDLPPVSLEREIIKNRVACDGWEINDERLNTIMSIAEEIRGLSRDGTIPVTWSVGPQIKVARASRWFSMVVAYRRAIADHLEPEAQAALLDVVKAHATD